MPTPFSHLQITVRLMHDAAVPQVVRDFAAHYAPDFLLGGIIADQRPDGGARADTHFYEYTKPMPDHPWREMFRQHPSLHDLKSEAHHAFLCGYVAHLAADEFWSLHMLKPHFAQSDWGNDRRQRFFLLHLLLVTMDERDERLLPDEIDSVIRRCVPDGWLPFLSDVLICEWRDFLVDQIANDDSHTLQIFGGRISTSPEDLRTLLDDDAYMQRELWDNVSRDILAEIERDMYQFSREQLLIYWAETAKTPR